jgi:hypothetical protein
MIMGFTFNKALGGGVAAGLLTLLGSITPLASHFPVLAAVIGVATFILTWLTPKNAPPSSGV